jgi:hypothetical protein
MPDALPPESLLKSYHELGAYTDCQTRDVAGMVTLADYISAFYTSPAFRPERLILSWLSMPSTDDDVAGLAAGTITRFAAWTVEHRTETQILLCDYQSRTRSWLMVAPAGLNSTRLYFGSAITQVDKTASKRALAKMAFYGLLWFHKIYALVLIRAAATRVAKGVAVAK